MPIAHICARSKNQVQRESWSPNYGNSMLCWSKVRSKKDRTIDRFPFFLLIFLKNWICSCILCGVCRCKEIQKRLSFYCPKMCEDPDKVYQSWEREGNFESVIRWITPNPPTHTPTALTSHKNRLSQQGLSHRCLLLCLPLFSWCFVLSTHQVAQKSSLGGLLFGQRPHTPEDGFLWGNLCSSSVIRFSLRQNFVCFCSIFARLCDFSVSQ